MKTIHGAPLALLAGALALGSAGAYMKGTDANHDLYTVKGRDWSKARLVGLVTYTF